MFEIDRVALANLTQFSPFAKYSDEKTWESVDNDIKNKLIKEAEALLDKVWSIDLITERLDYHTTGKRSNTYRERALATVILALAECVDRKGRFLRLLANLIWSVCEVSVWVPAEHYPGTAVPDLSANPEFIDLVAAETAAGLAWVYYLLREQLDEISAEFCKRIEYELEKRIIKPYLAHPETMWWTGMDGKHRTTNWSVWITVNITAVALIMPLDKDVRQSVLANCCHTVERYYSEVADDGGCDEGPGYWLASGAVLFDFLEMLYCASDGGIDLYSDNKLRKIGMYIARVHIHGRNFVNICDANARMDVPAELIYRFGKRTGSEVLKSMGVSVMHNTNQTDYMLFTNHAGNMYRKLCFIFGRNEVLQQKECANPAPKDMHMKHIGLMAARSKHLYLCVNTGHNGVRHNHNDSGNYILYLDGAPVIIDIGVEKYTKKTFGQSRYSVWTMRSSYHNLPVINGCEQSYGQEFSVNNVSYCAGQNMYVKMNLDGAYPENTGIVSFERTLELLRQEDRMICTESFELLKPSQLCFNLMSYPKPQQISDGCILFTAENGKSITVEYPNGVFDVTVEEYPIDDVRLNKSWDVVYRTVFSVKGDIRTGCFTFAFTADK